MAYAVYNIFFESVSDNLNNSESKCFLLGDFNMSYMQWIKHGDDLYATYFECRAQVASSLYDFMSPNGMFQLNYVKNNNGKTCIKELFWTSIK